MSASNYNEKDLVPSAIFEEISDALSIVEKQLLLPSTNLKENPKNFRNRILQIGKQVSTKNYTLEKQISSLLNSDNLDNNLVKETLQSMHNTLEKQNTISFANEQINQQINELTDIAFNQNSTLDQLREALKRSLTLNQQTSMPSSQITPASSNAEPAITIQQNGNTNKTSVSYLPSDNIMDVKRKEDTQNYNKNQTKLPLIVQTSKPIYGNLDDLDDDVFDDEFSIFSNESQNSKINELENRLRSINKQCNDLKNQLRVQKNAYQDLQEKSKQAIQQHNDMKDKIDTLTSEKEKLERMLNLAKKKITQLQKKDEIDYKKFYESISSIVKQSKSYKEQIEENVVPTVQKVFSEYDTFLQYQTESNSAFKQIQAILSIKNDENLAYNNQPSQAHSQLMRKIIEKVKEIIIENKKLKEKSKLSISNSILRYHSNDLEIQKIEKERNEINSILQTFGATASDNNSAEGGHDIGTRLKNLILMRDQLQEEIAKREDEIKKLKSQHQILEDTIKSIISAVNPNIAYDPTDSSCEPPKDLLENITALVNERNKFQAEKDNLLEVQIQVTTERDQLTLEKKKSIDKLSGLAKFLNQESNFNGEGNEADLVDALENQIHTLNQLLPLSSDDPNEPIANRINHLLKEYNRLKENQDKNSKLESDLITLSSVLNPSSEQGGASNISDAIENLKKKIKQNQEDEETIISLLSSKVNLEDDQNNSESKIIRGIKQLLNELDQNQKQLQEGDPQKVLSDLAESLNIKLDPNQDVSQLKSALQSQLSKKVEQGQSDQIQNILNQYQDSEFIKQIQSESNGSEFNLADAFNKLCKEYTDLESKYEQEVKNNKESRQRLNEILGFSPTDDVTNEDIQKKVSKITNDHNSILSMLGIDGVPEGSNENSGTSNDDGEGNIANQVRKLYDENKRLNELLNSKGPDDSSIILTDQSRLAQMNNELNEGLKRLNIDIDNLPEGETINTVLLKGLEKIQKDQKDMEDQLATVLKERENLNKTIQAIKSIMKGTNPDFDENAPLDPNQLEQMLGELRTLVAVKEKFEADEKKDEKEKMSEIKSILSSYKNDNPDDENLVNDEEINLVDQIRELVREKEKLKQSKMEILKVLKIEGNATDEEILCKANDIASQQQHDESVAELARILSIPNENNETDQELLRNILAKIKSNSSITERSINLNPSENDEFTESNPESVQALKRENQHLKEEIQKQKEALKSIHSMFYPDRKDTPLDELPETLVSDIRKKIGPNRSSTPGSTENAEDFNEIGEDGQFIGESTVPTSPASPRSLLQENKQLRSKLANAEAEIQSLNEKLIENQSRVSGILEERESVSSLIQDLTQTIKKNMLNQGQDEALEDSAVLQKLSEISTTLSEQNSMLTSLQEEKKSKNLQNGENENKSLFNDPDATFTSRFDQNIDRIMTMLDISPIQADPNASPDEIRCEKTSSIIGKIRQLKGRNSIMSDPNGFPELNQSTSDMYNYSIMANDQSEQSFMEEEEEGDLNDPPTFSRDRSGQNHMMMPSRGIQEIINKKNDIIKSQMDAFKKMASSLRINPEQYADNDPQLIEEIVNHVRRLTGDNHLDGISDEPASFSSEPLTQSDQPYTPRRHTEEEESNQLKLNLKGISHVDENINQNGGQQRRPQLARLNLNGLSQASDNQNQQNSSTRPERLYYDDQSQNENEIETEAEDENEDVNNNIDDNNLQNYNRNRNKNSKHGRKTDDDFLIQKLNDISSDLSEQQKILKQMEESHKSSTKIKSLERSLADQQGHWNDLRRALGIPEVAGKEEEEDVTDIQIRMLDKIKQLSALHEASESEQASTPRSTNSETPAELENSQIKDLTNLLTIANSTIQTYKDEKDKILKILDSEKQASSAQPESPPDHNELEPISEKLDELRSHISANIDAIMSISRDKLGQNGTEESGTNEGTNNEDTLAIMNENLPMSPISGPKSPGANTFDRLKEDLNQLTIDNEEKDKEISTLSTKVNGLNTIIIEFNDKNTKIMNENQSLLKTKEIQTNGANIDNHDAEIVEEEEQFDDLGLVANLKEEVDKLKALIDSTSCSISELNQKRSEIMKLQVPSKSETSKNNNKKSNSINRHLFDNLSLPENEPNEQAKELNGQNDETDNQKREPNVHTRSINNHNNENNETEQNLSNSSKDSSQVSGVFDSLRIQMNNLKKSNEEKDKRIKELEEKNDELMKERQAFLPNSNSDSDQDNGLSNQVQSLNKELAEQCDEIERLKALLDQTKNDLQSMKDERDSIMKSLFPDIEHYNDDVNASQLLNNLTDLDNQVSQQTNEIKSTTDLSNNEDNSALNIIIPTQRTRRNIPKSPKTQITDAFNQLKAQIIELTEKNNDLETKLSEAQATIEHLRAEREMFLHGLGSDDLNMNNDLSKELFKKLNFLDSQISSQNAEIGDAINTSKMDNEMPSSPVPSPKSSRHNRGVLSIRAQTNAQFNSTLEEMTKKVKNLTLENLEKDSRISELEEKIDDLEKKLNGSTNPEVQTRHIELNLDGDNIDGKPLNQAVQKLSKALDKTDGEVRVDTTDQGETIQDLRSQIEALTKARESIASLLSEVSRRAKNLVQQITTLKSNEKGKNKTKSLSQWQELERSALDFNAKLQSSTVEFNLNGSDSLISTEVQTERSMFNNDNDDESIEDKEDKINELKKQIQRLTETKNSISKLFKEVSKSSKHLIQEIKRLKSNPNNSTIEESLNKLETTAEDLASHNSKVEAFINSSQEDDINTSLLESKLKAALEENQKLKDQLNDAQLKLEAVKESEKVITELAYFKKDEPSAENNDIVEEEEEVESDKEKEEEMDKNKQIELLQQKIESLTKARESITKLFMEVSRQARSLVEEIKELKKKNHSSSSNASHELETIENSAHTIAKSHEKEKQNEEKIQTLENELSLAQKKINELTSRLTKDNSITTMRSPVNIQLDILRKELVVSDINSTSSQKNKEDDSDKIKRLQKQVESLQKANGSMNQLFTEISQRSKLLVKQMEEFKPNKKDKKVVKLESEIKDLYEAQLIIQNAIENQKIEPLNNANQSSFSHSNSSSSSNELLKKQNAILTEKVNKLESSLQLAENRNDELAKKLDLTEKKLSLIGESNPTISNFIKVVTSLTENEESENEEQRKENAASLQEKLDNLQEARESICNLANGLARSSQSLTKSISSLKTKNPSSKEISVLEMNANALNSSLNREAKLSELTKKAAEYQHRIAELESIIRTSNHTNVKDDHNIDDFEDDFNENSIPPSNVTKRSLNLNNEGKDFEALQNQINQIEAVLNDEDVISDFPLVQELISRLTQANKSGNRKRFTTPPSSPTVLSPTSTSDSILKQLKAARSEIESLKQQLTKVNEFVNERDDIDSILHGEIDNVDTKSSPLVRSIMQLYNIAHEPISEIQGLGFTSSIKNTSDVEALKSQIFELNKQNELKRLELSQISAILNGNDEINGDNFDLNASLDENIVQRLRDTLSSYKNDSRDKLIKEINSLKSHLDKSSNAQLLSTLKHQITELEEQNNELTENLNKISKERASIAAVVNGKKPSIRTQLVEQVLAFVDDTPNVNNNTGVPISNSSLMQQVNEMNSDNDNEDVSGTFNLKGIPISSSNFSLNDELTDGNNADVDSISSIRSIDQNDNTSNKDLVTENETLKQKLSETQELVNVYAHQFSKVEKFLKLKQVGTIAQRAKAIALKINEERKNLQIFEERNKKLNAKYQNAKIKITQLQQNKNAENSSFTHTDSTAEIKQNDNNANFASYRSKLSNYVNDMKSKFLSLVDTDKSNALTNADQLFAELELAIHMVDDNSNNNTNEVDD